MKKQKDKSKRRISWAAWIIVAIIILVGIIAPFFFRDSERIIQNSLYNAVKLSVGDADFAIVYVINESLDARIINNRVAEAKILRASFDEIDKKQYLPLVGEPELGRIVEYQVPKNSSDYIYALEAYFKSKDFGTEVIYSEYQKEPGKSSWRECSEMYDEINSDLQNANYCEEDLDCHTLPLGSMYIEFGCYHYINLEENSTDFYNRMNYYSAYCSDIIDLCSPIPDSKCVNGKCVEAGLPAEG